MTVNQVRYVFEIAKLGSMTKAAARFYITQPALSEQVQALEAELDCSLFRRTSRGTELTEAGEFFCTEAEPALRAWENFEQNCARLKDPLSKSIRIGFGLRARSNGLFESVVKIFEGHPDVSFSVVTDMKENYLDAVDAGRIDIAIGRIYDGQSDGLSGRISVFPLLSEPQCILMSLDDPLCKESCLPIGILNGRSAVCGPVGSGDDLEMKRLCVAEGVKVSRVLHADDIYAVISLVQRKQGYALGPTSFAAYFGISAVPLEPRMDVSLNLICRKEDRNSPLIRRLRKHLETSLSGF